MPQPLTRTDFKYEESLVHVGKRGDLFRVHVVEVDHNETVDDDNKTPRFKHISPKNNNRGFHISGIRVDGKGKHMIDIIVPGHVAGDFKLPQPGDTVWVRQSEEGGDSSAYYVNNDYSNDVIDVEYKNNPPPLWGSMFGDFGHLRSYKDHSMQFASKITKHVYKTIPKEPSNFRRKWVRSISGYRWRKFYKGNALPSLFVNRGDNVYDLDFKNMAKAYVEEDGVTLMDKKTPQYAYPDPNNVPELREDDDDFTYIYRKHIYVKRVPNTDPNEDGVFNPPKDEYFTYVHKVKHYTAYEPLSDKSYKKKTKGFERELPAVREHNTVFYGNNKLMYQDVHGDGEQILITLKNQYDSGITILHDTDRSQIRIRDHVGNTILLDGDPEKPRIVLMTKDRRVMEVGDMAKGGDSKGFVYFRNGGGYGNAQVPWGRMTNKGRGEVFNQEFLMVDHVDVIRDPEFLGRLSPVLRSQLRGPGIYTRTAADGEKSYEKRTSSYEMNNILVDSRIETWTDTDTMVAHQSKVGKGSHEFFSIGQTNGEEINTVKFSDTYLNLSRPKEGSSVQLDTSGLHLDSNLPINISSSSSVNVKAPTINLDPGAASVKEQSGKPETLPVNPITEPYVGFPAEADDG
jgi:hypothetical protein